jgi:lysozyme
VIPDFKSLIERIGVNEGFRSKPYQCTEGVWTIGHGLTWITEEESLSILTGRISQLHLKLLDDLDWYEDMPPEIKGVLIEMIYQIGYSGVKKFRKMLANMKEHNWKGAADEMLDSLWAKQTSNRANRLADIVREHG